MLAPGIQTPGLQAVRANSCGISPSGCGDLQEQLQESHTAIDAGLNPSEPASHLPTALSQAPATPASSSSPVLSPTEASSPFPPPHHTVPLATCFPLTPPPLLSPFRIRLSLLQKPFSTPSPQRIVDPPTWSRDFQSWER